MMSTGITLADECVTEFNIPSMKRSHRYMILKPNDEKTNIVIEKLGAREATFEQFKEDMPKDQCR